MSLHLPSRIEAYARLRAAKPPEWVLRHCVAVEAMAVAMATRAPAADAELVSRGALLHDIGRSQTQDVRHAYLGADMLRKPPPLPEPLVRVVETHTGGGVAAEEAHRLGLPDRDYVPRTLEQKIVAHADNLYAGVKRQSLAAIEAKYRSRGLEDAWVRIEALHTELSALLDLDLEALQPADLAFPG